MHLLFVAQRRRRLTLLFLVAVLVAVAGGGLSLPARADAAAIDGVRVNGVTERACVGDIFGANLPAPKDDLSSVTPALLSEFSALGRPAAAGDTPGGDDGADDRNLLGLLSGRFVTRFDAAGSRRLGTIDDTNVYLVPVVLGRVTVPAACLHIRALAGIGALAREERAMMGSGPGLCVITQMTAAAGTENGNIACGSAATLGGYLGAVDVSVNGSPYALVPDGVASVEDKYGPTRRDTVTVQDNLAAVPTSPSLPYPGDNFAQLRKALARDLPTSILELNGSGAVVRTLTRPADAISLFVAAFPFQKRLLTPVASSSGVSSPASGSIPAISATCSSTGACSATFTSERCPAKASEPCTVTTERTVCSAQHVCRVTVSTKHTTDRTPASSGDGTISGSDGGTLFASRPGSGGAKPREHSTPASS